MADRDAFLQRLAAGMHHGFALDWQHNGISHAWPGQSLWARAARIKTRWRRSKLLPGARVVVSIPNSPAYVAYMLACWMGGWTFCPLPNLHPQETRRRLQRLQPALWIHYSAQRLQEIPCNGLPQEDLDAALIMWSSGSMGAGNAYRLRFSALQWQVDAHLPALQLSTDSLIWNTLPWAHVFAGVLELLTAGIAGSVIQVNAQRARHPPPDCTHLFTVPRIARLLDQQQIGALEGGIIGGAPLGTQLAEQLQGSKLRVGYGQTEAGPGITLGLPGEFHPFILGFPLVQCTIAGGTLRYQSPGQADAFLDASGWQNMPQEQGWRNSGDEVYQNPQGCLYWLGRHDGGFSLANGQSVRSEAEEARLMDVYPQADSIVLGAPGSRHLSVVANVSEAQKAAFIRHWHEPYRLHVPGQTFWEKAPSSQGKPNRRWLYENWPE
ncbi:hypothetical protein B1757_08040 [Acidithiobacillus marinus]|uniref:AMP-dependent synthetase/ligase domain-containing protein n=1 Tax=Acidithiobacillus marinus TaxID=187490 RepID=A0A2I1DKY1_9PROT|nr:AMP-binding protein [Acidithiobacillus marinus]PKY10525.1 hypothetical protein B1757_08040 [Acidithiobacillus marinus]